MHVFLIGLLLGWGAAIPIGPINLEIFRRNLRFGTAHGLLFGFGATAADLTYLILMSLGALTFLTHSKVLKIVGVIGSLILAWFGYSALRMKPAENSVADTGNEKVPPLWSQTAAAYMMTLFNPMTILFWSSVSAQVVTLTNQHIPSVVIAGCGVLAGTVSWELAINIVLHFTRHRLPAKTIHWLNGAGGIILLGFAVFGLWHALF